MNRLLKPIRRMVKVVTLTLLGIQSMTPAMASVRDEDYTRWTPVSEAVLDSMRGGGNETRMGLFCHSGLSEACFSMISSSV